MALIAALVVVALIAAVVVIGRSRSGSEVDTGAGPSAGGTTAIAAQQELLLEPASFAGDDPFTTSVTVTEVAEFPGSVTAVVDKRAQGETVDSGTGTRTATGSTPGLYGGTRNDSACDASAIATFLAENPDKAGAWAAVQRLTPAALPDFITSLTPVVLTSDTRVTNHGFKQGRAVPTQSVLQAGTAVLVDKTGAPRVKCSCGNPLLAPAAINVGTASTRGATWNGYQPGRVTTITPGAEATELTLVDLTNGNLYTQPTGSSGGGDVVLIAAGASGKAARDRTPNPELGIGVGTPRNIRQKFLVGSPFDAAVVGLTAVLGPPATDKIKTEQDDCGRDQPSTPRTTRTVSWPGLELIGEGVASNAVLTFVHVYGPAPQSERAPANAPPPWKTEKGIGIGSTTAELQAIYPEARVQQAGRGPGQVDASQSTMLVAGGVSYYLNAGQVAYLYISASDDC